MRNLALFVALLAGFHIANIAFAQTRNVAYNATGFEVTTIRASKLEDGGWSASWCGTLVSDAGDTLTGCTGFYNMGLPINVNRLDAIASAGTNRWLREFRFDVDAGSP